jgi:hypothetical protein
VAAAHHQGRKAKEGLGACDSWSCEVTNWWVEVVELTDSWWLLIRDGKKAPLEGVQSVRILFKVDTGFWFELGGWAYFFSYASVTGFPHWIPDANPGIGNIASRLKLLRNSNQDPGDPGEEHSPLAAAAAVASSQRAFPWIWWATFRTHMLGHIACQGAVVVGALQRWGCGTNMQAYVCAVCKDARACVVIAAVVFLLQTALRNGG